MQKLFANIILIILLICSFQPTGAQSLTRDLQMIQSKTLPVTTFHEHIHQPEFLFSDHPSALVRFNPLTLAFGSLMWVYQKAITQQLSSTCIYSPTCSGYSISLIEEYGLLPGIIFTADRLTRCNRLALYDFPENEIDYRIQRIRQDVSYYRINHE